MRWGTLLLAACLLTLAPGVDAAPVDPWADEPCDGLDVGGVTGTCTYGTCTYYYVVGVLVAQQCGP